LVAFRPETISVVNSFVLRRWRSSR
jgi:hypothetical protein